MALPQFADRGAPPLGYLGRLRPLPPIWREARAPGESRDLLRDPIFTGDGLPRGHGEPVLLIPGFLGSDGMLGTLRDWLNRLGYQAELTGMLFNIRYSEAELVTLMARLTELHAASGQPVALIGHSRGGLLAKVAAHRHPGLVARVIGLGAPLADPYDLNPLVIVAVRAAQALNRVAFGRTGRVERRFLRDLAAPARVPLTSVYTRSDGIVHWGACLRDDAECVEIDGSHSGLAVNPAAYAVIANVLAGR